MAIQKRFSRLKFHVHELKEGERLEERFPKLFTIPGFKEFSHKQKDKIICYLVFLYDDGSDLYDEFEELKDRKDAAAIEAGFQRNKKDEWPEYLQDIMDINGEIGQKILPLILAYLKFCKNDIWRELQVTEHEYEMILKQRMTPIPELEKKDSGEIMIKRAKLKEMSDLNLRSMNSLKRQFYADNADVEEAEKKIPPIKPENADKVIKMYANVS